MLLEWLLLDGRFAGGDCDHLVGHDDVDLIIDLHIVQVFVVNDSRGNSIRTDFNVQGVRVLWSVVRVHIIHALLHFRILF